MLNQTQSPDSISNQPIAKISGGDGAWEALDRFIVAIQEGKQASDKCCVGLNALREATGAQVAFLYSLELNRLLEIVGDPCPPEHWCRNLTTRLKADLPRGGVWSSSVPEEGAAAQRAQAPFTAAVIPVESPRPSWLVVISLDPDRPLNESDLKVVRVIWRLQVGQSRHALVYDNLRETLFGIVSCLSTAIDAKDPYTCGHSERVARIAVRLGEQMGIARAEISDLYLAGLLHDVGKIGIRDDVLCKPGPLTPEEYDHIKEHPVTGERIIANVTRLAYLRPGVRGHHEHFDGTGYPDGLAGEAIPLMARILAVADSCDAMMAARRYRPPLSPNKIEEIFKKGSGTQWDPHIVEAFFACRRELYEVCQRGLGQSVYMAVERAASGDSSENLVLPLGRGRVSAALR